jgi:hypothetical protein
MKKGNVKEFIDTYKRAKYFVLKEDNFNKVPENIDFTITVDQIIVQIDTCIKSSLLNNQSWTYITAFNPYSEECSKEKNRQQNQQLLEELQGHPDNFIIRYGFGTGSDYDKQKRLSEQSNLTWQPEESFLVIGISREDAIAVGKKYKQNAILFGEKSNPTELVVINQ